MKQNILSDTGIGLFNNCLQAINVGRETSHRQSLFAVRKKALEMIQRTYGDTGLKLLLDDLREYRPHWKIKTLDSPLKSCLFLLVLMEGKSNLTFNVVPGKHPLSNDWKRGSVRRNASPIVYIMNKFFEKDAKCMAHPEKKALNRNLCGTCYARVKALHKEGLITEKSSIKFVKKVLAIPVKRGKRGWYIAEVKYRMEFGWDEDYEA